MLLLLLNGRQSFGQRVYANTEQHSAPVTVPILGTLLANVGNPSYAYDSDHSNYSSLNVLVALLGINTARQNLQYTGSIKPIPGSPMYMKIEANGLTVLSLLTSIRMVRTLGGINNEVGPSYNSSQFLNLLGLLPSGSSTYLVTPLNNTANFDGLKLVNGDGLAAVAGTANLYYSFFIATPNISADTDTLCQNALATSLTLNLNNNRDTGIVYYLFTDDTTGLNYRPNAMLNPSAAAGYIGTFSNHQMTIPNPFLNAGTGNKTQNYLIIAKDTADSPALFYSAWKKITYKRTIRPVPGQATVGIQ